MAHPFGGHPTFAEYLRWAAEHGCEVKTGIRVTETGDMITVTRIVAPGAGRWVFEVGTEQKDYLTPTTVFRLDRRLGLKSPFFSIDPQTGEA